MRHYRGRGGADKRGIIIEAVRLTILSAIVLVPLAVSAQQPHLCEAWTIPCAPDDRQCVVHSPRVLKVDGGPGYRDWLNQDVRWIITNEERTAFKNLRNDEERDKFIEQFWDRRDPTPTTLENEFRDRYYERIRYANENFESSKEPGWRTPRGRIYVMYGAPDEIEQRTGNLETETSKVVLGQQGRVPKYDGPYELWRYTKVVGIDHPVTITFADALGTGEPAAIVDRADVDWLGGPARPHYKLECGGKYDPNNPPPGGAAIICLEDAPQPQLKDLAEIVYHKIDLRMLRFEVGFSFQPLTSRTVRTEIDLAFSPSLLKWAQGSDSATAHVQIYGHILTLTNRVAESFERDVTFNRAQATAHESRERIDVPLYLFPGIYRVELAAKDVNGDMVGTFSRTVHVPDLGSWCQD